MRQVASRAAILFLTQTCVVLVVMRNVSAFLPAGRVLFQPGRVQNLISPSIPGMTWKGGGKFLKFGRLRMLHADTEQGHGQRVTGASGAALALGGLAAGLSWLDYTRGSCVCFPCMRRYFFCASLHKTSTSTSVIRNACAPDLSLIAQTFFGIPRLESENSKSKATRSKIHGSNGRELITNIIFRWKIEEILHASLQWLRRKSKSCGRVDRRDSGRSRNDQISLQEILTHNNAQTRRRLLP